MRLLIIPVLAVLLVVTPITLSYAPLMESTVSAQAIPIPPGVGGLLGTFAGEYGLTALWAAWFVSWALFIVIATLGWYEFINVLTSNRPKIGPDSATDDVALFLLASTNPIVQQYGLHVRGFERLGVPLSSSNPYSQCLMEKDAWALCGDLITQFATPTNNLGGLDDCDAYLALTRFHNPDSNQLAIHWREMFDDEYWAGIKTGRMNPDTGFPYVSTNGTKLKITCALPTQHYVGFKCIPCGSVPYVNSCRGFGLPC